MGSFLGDIQGRTVAVDTALLNSTHSKLIEYYSSYKSICEGFTITIPEYTHIFGPNQLSFSLWDTRGRGKIDAIEMFSGLLVFSKIRYQQKIKFLFEIFDFNQQGFLQYQNLAFMILNVCNATYKVLSLQKTVSQSTIQTFLDEYFTEESRVELPRLIRWTTKNKYVGEFFREIGYEMDQSSEERRVDEYTVAEATAKRRKNQKVYTFDKELRFDGKFMGCIDGLVEKKLAAQEEMLNLQFEWVFGMEVGRENIRFMRVQGQKAGNERIIYSIGKIIVIYFPKLNTQQYYKGHTQSISVIEISKFNKIAASAQTGEYPSIHIWDIHNRVNLIKFKMVHKYPLKFLKFFKEDRYLVTASESLKFGGEIESPVIILKLDTKEIIMSTYLRLEIIGICPTNFKEGSTLLISKTSLAVLAQTDRSFTMHKYQLKNQQLAREIIAFVYHPQGYLITAHKNRQFCKWDQKFNCTVIRFQSLSPHEIIQLALIGEDTLLVLDESEIQVVTVRITETYSFKRRKLLGLSENRLFNLRLFSMQVVEGSKLLVVSEFGDVIKVSDIDAVDTRLQKYYQLFKMEEATNVFTPNAHTIVLASSNFLYSLDRYEKDLRVLAKYEFQIRQADECKEYIITASIMENKTTVLNLIWLGDHSVRETYRLNFLVQDVKITENYILTFSESTLTVFHKVQERYFGKEPISHKLTIGKMLSFARENDQRNFLVINEAKEIFKMVINGVSQIDIQKIDKQPEGNLFHRLSICYPEQNYKYPFVVTSNKRLVAFGRKNGDIMLWESLASAQNNFSSYTFMSFHTDRISQLVLNDQELFSVGGLDGMVIQFQHKHYVEASEEDEYEEEDQQKDRKKRVTKTIWKEGHVNMSVRELQGSGLRQGEVELSGLADPQNLQVRQLVQQILTPSDRVNFTSQTQQPQHSERLVIQTNQSYGIDVNLSSRNIHYIHSYPSESALKKTLDDKLWKDSSLQASKEDLQYAKNVLLPIDQDHGNCRRQIVYASDRFCVLWEKGTPQQLYKFHRRKVSAIAVHPNKQLICSCQVSSSYVDIHFWRHQERTIHLSITSRHRNIITKATFSRDGEWVVTLGGSQRAQSIQIFNWQNEETIAFRFIEDELLKEVLFNPYDKKELCFAGLGLIRLYRVEEELVIKQECRVELQTFQAIVYTSNIYGSEIESDIISGSHQGDIGLYACGSFIIARKKAHDKGITCLRLVQLFQYKKVLVSGGGDGYVRIWDIKFNEISRKNINDQLYSISSNSLDMPESIIVNIDIYQCQKKVGNQNSTSALMLIATSDGSVLEATITNEFQGYRAVSLMTAESQSLKEKINFDISLAFTAPPNQHPFRFQLARNLLITYSDKSKFLFVWNLNFDTREKIFPLQSAPLFLSKMNQREVIAVGLQDCVGACLKMYELEWSAGVYLRAITPVGQIDMQKANYLPKGAAFSRSDCKLAVRMKNQEIEEIWLYEREEGDKGCNYAIRNRIEEKVAGLKLLWIEYSTKEDAIMTAWKEGKLESHLDTQVKYKCYDCNNGSNLALGCFQFDKFDFSAKVKAIYVPCFQLAGFGQKDYLAKDSISVTTMTQYDRFLLMGTSSGEIIVAESQVFARKEIEPKYYASCYVVSDSPINHIEVRQSEIISSSESGQAIFISNLKLQKGFKKQSVKDPFNQQLGLEQLQKKVKDVYQKRKKIQSQIQSLSISCGIELKLSAVIGRSAFHKRNNIFIDLKDNIISFSGCNLLIMKHEEGKRLNQRIVKPDISPTSSHPEISCIILGDCKRFLLVGTSEENAKIIAWDISTNTNLFDIKLNGFVIVNLLKLSFSNRHAAVLATAKNGQQYLLFIDLTNKNVLAVHHFHNPVQINDLCFALGQEFRILACGVRYMAEWNYCNNLLTERLYNFSSAENEDIKAEAIIFYSLIFIEEYAISSGSDGYLYVWKDERVVKRQNAHPKESILSLYTSLNSKIFVSGANNGTVNIWHFSSSLIIQKLDQYSIYTPKQGKDSKEGKQSRVPLKYQVQSICMTKESLIVGNRAGEIVHFPFSVDHQKLGEEIAVVSNKFPLPILSGFNHQVIKSCAFNTYSTKLYVMTEAESSYGVFTVFDLANMEKIKEEKLELKSPLIRMLACKASSKIFMVLKGAIMIYNYQAEVKDEKYNKLTKGKQWLKCELEIKAAAINNSETFLAVLVAPGPLQNAKIEIYNLTVVEGQFFSQYKVEQNLQASIDVIDFCTDHEYLVYQGTDEEQTIIDLMTKEKIKAGTLENPPDWNQDAKRTTPSIKEIAIFYSEENKLLKLVQVMNKGVIATDEMGSVRVFAYPITANKEQNYEAYIEHLNQVYLCVLSHDNRTLVTASREDRALHIWDLIHK